MKRPPRILVMTPEIQHELTERGRLLHESGKLPESEIGRWINQELIKLAQPMDKLLIIRMKAEAEKLKSLGYSFKLVRQQLLDKFQLNTASND